MGLALGVGWVGYTLAYFGWCSTRGAGVGLLDLVIPGRTVIIPGGGATGGTGGKFFGPGNGPGGSTLTVDPNTGAITHITPGPTDRNPQPGGTIA